MGHGFPALLQVHKERETTFLSGQGFDPRSLVSEAVHENA